VGRRGGRAITGIGKEGGAFGSKNRVEEKTLRVDRHKGERPSLFEKKETKECHQNGIGGAHQWNRKGSRSITQRGDGAEAGLLPVPIEGDQRLRRQKPRVQEGKGAGVGARGRRGGGGGRGGRGRRGGVVAVVGESKREEEK